MKQTTWAREYASACSLADTYNARGLLSLGLKCEDAADRLASKAPDKPLADLVHLLKHRTGGRCPSGWIMTLAAKCARVFDDSDIALAFTLAQESDYPAPLFNKDGQNAE